MSKRINMAANKAAMFALHRASTHLYDTGRKSVADRIGLMAGVNMFTVGEVLAVIAFALDRPEDEAVIKEIDALVTSDKRFTRTKTVFERRKAAV